MDYDANQEFHKKEYAFRYLVELAKTGKYNFVCSNQIEKSLFGIVAIHDGPSKNDMWIKWPIYTELLNPTQPIYPRIEINKNASVEEFLSFAKQTRQRCDDLRAQKFGLISTTLQGEIKSVIKQIPFTKLKDVQDFDLKTWRNSTLEVAQVHPENTINIIDICRAAGTCICCHRYCNQKCYYIG